MPGLLLRSPLVAALLALAPASLAVDPGEDGRKSREGSSPTSVAIEGTVVYTGPLPEPIPVPEAGTDRHLVEVDEKTKGLKDAVVWLEGVPAGREPADGGGARPLQMDQQNYFFVPHVLAVEAGQEVEFLNNDAANHGVTAASFEPKNSFNVTTPPGGSYKHRFVATKRPVAIGCPIHGSMSAWVFVFEHPHHAVTDGNGAFRLPPAPPGRYTLCVRHQDGGMSRREEITVGPGGGPPRIRITFGKDDLTPRRSSYRSRSGSLNGRVSALADDFSKGNAYKQEVTVKSFYDGSVGGDQPDLSVLVEDS